MAITVIVANTGVHYEYRNIVVTPCDIARDWNVKKLQLLEPVHLTPLSWTAPLTPGEVYFAYVSPIFASLIPAPLPVNDGSAALCLKNREEGYSTLQRFVSSQLKKLRKIAAEEYTRLSALVSNTTPLVSLVEVAAKVSMCLAQLMKRQVGGGSLQVSPLLRCSSSTLLEQQEDTHRKFMKCLQFLRMNDSSNLSSGIRFFSSSNRATAKFCCSQGSAQRLLELFESTQRSSLIKEEEILTLAATTFTAKLLELHTKGVLVVLNEAELRNLIVKEYSNSLPIAPPASVLFHYLCRPHEEDKTSAIILLRSTSKVVASQQGKPLHMVFLLSIANHGSAETNSGGNHGSAVLEVVTGVDPSTTFQWLQRPESNSYLTESMDQQTAKNFLKKGCYLESWSMSTFNKRCSILLGQDTNQWLRHTHRTVVFIATDDEKNFMFESPLQTPMVSSALVLLFTKSIKRTAGSRIQQLAKMNSVHLFTADSLPKLRKNYLDALQRIQQDCFSNECGTVTVRTKIGAQQHQSVVSIPRISKFFCYVVVLPHWGEKHQAALTIENCERVQDEAQFQMMTVL